MLQPGCICISCEAKYVPHLDWACKLVCSGIEPNVRSSSKQDSCDCLCQPRPTVAKRNLTTIS